MEKGKSPEKDTTAKPTPDFKSLENMINTSSAPAHNDPFENGFITEKDDHFLKKHGKKDFNNGGGNTD